MPAAVHPFDRDQLVRNFVSAWQRSTTSGQNPDLSAFLAQAPREHLQQSFEALLEVELSYLPIRTESALPTYLERFPDHADAVRTKFGQRTPPGFDLLGVLQRDSVGLVYLARSLESGDEVALKVYLRGATLTRDNVVLFRDDVQRFENLSHPNIVPIHKVGMHNHRPFVVRAHSRGESLSRLFAGKPLLPRDAVRIVAKLADALEAAHSTGLIHREVSPDNVFLDEDDNVQVADFGFAYHHTEQAFDEFGTPGSLLYLAPEQVTRAGFSTPATDVHALGAVFFFLLTGRAPYVGSNRNELLQAIAQEQPPAPSEAGASGDSLDAICLRCLSKNPLDRPRTAGQLADELRQASKPRRRWVTGVSACVGLLLGLVAGFAFWPSNPTEQQPPEDDSRPRSVAQKPTRPEALVRLSNRVDGYLQTASDPESSRSRALDAIRSGLALEPEFETALQDDALATDQKKAERRRWQDRRADLKGQALSRLSQLELTKTRTYRLPSAGERQWVSLAVSGDGKRAVVVYEGEADYALLDLEKGTTRRVRLPEPYPNYTVYKAYLSSKASLLVLLCPSRDGTVITFICLDLETGKLAAEVSSRFVDPLPDPANLRRLSPTEIGGESESGALVKWVLQSGKWQYRAPSRTGRPGLPPGGPISGPGGPGVRPPGGPFGGPGGFPPPRAEKEKPRIEREPRGSSLKAKIPESRSAITLWSPSDDSPAPEPPPAPPRFSRPDNRCRAMAAGIDPNLVCALTNSNLYLFELTSRDKVRVPLGYRETFFEGAVAPLPNGFLVLDVAPKQALTYPDRTPRQPGAPNPKRDLQLTLWTVEGTSSLYQRREHEAGTLASSLSPKGMHAVATDDGKLHIWRQGTLEQIDNNLSISPVRIPGSPFRSDNRSLRARFYGSTKPVLLVGLSEDPVDFPGDGGPPRMELPRVIRTDLLDARDGRLLHSFPARGDGRLLSPTVIDNDPNRPQPLAPMVVLDRAEQFGLVLTNEKRGSADLELWSMAGARRLATLGRYPSGNAGLSPSPAINAFFSPSGRWLLLAPFAARESGRLAPDLSYEIWELPASVGTIEGRPDKPRLVGEGEMPHHKIRCIFDPDETRVVVYGIDYNSPDVPGGFGGGSPNGGGFPSGAFPDRIPTGKKYQPIVIDLRSAKVQCKLETPVDVLWTEHNTAFGPKHLVAWTLPPTRASHKPTCRIWDLQSGKRLILVPERTWKTWHCVCANAEGTRVLLCEAAENRSGVPIEVFLYDVTTGRILVQKKFDRADGYSPNSWCMRDKHHVYFATRRDPKQPRSPSKPVAMRWTDGKEVTPPFERLLGFTRGANYHIWQHPKGPMLTGPEWPESLLLEAKFDQPFETEITVRNGLIRLEKPTRTRFPTPAVYQGIWDAKTGKPLWRPTEERLIRANLDEGWLIVQRPRQSALTIVDLRVRPAKTFQLDMNSKKIPPGISSTLVAALPRAHLDSQRFLWMWDGALELWDYSNNTRLATVGRKGHAGAIEHMSLHRNRLASGDRSGAVCLWDGVYRRFLRTIATHRGRVTGVSVLPDGTILSAGEDGQLLLHNLAGDRRWSWKTPKEGVAIASMAVDKSGKRIALGLSDGTLVDFIERQPPTLTPLSKSPIRTLAFSPKADRLVVADAKGQVVVWDCASKKSLRTWQESEPPTALECGDSFVAIGTSTVCLRDLDTGTPRWRLPRKGGPVRALELDESGQRLWITDSSKQLTMYDLEAVRRRLSGVGE